MEDAEGSFETPRKDEEPQISVSSVKEEPSSPPVVKGEPELTIAAPTSDDNTANSPAADLAEHPKMESELPPRSTSIPPPSSDSSAGIHHSLTPAKRRPKPPTKGILKPPPPPAKPTLTNKIRDIVMGSVNVVGGGARTLFEQVDPEASSSTGPTYSGRGGPTIPNGYNGSNTPGQIAGSSSAAAAAAVTAAVGGTLNALSGRFGLGLGRFSSPVASTSSSPSSSPMPKSVSLPETGNLPMSEKSRQKQPLKRATFVLPNMSITYPISSQGEPWSHKVIEDRQRIESTHQSWLTTTTGADYWTSQKLVTLYESACRIREERPRPGIIRSLEVLGNPPRPRQILLSLTHNDLSSQSISSGPIPHILETALNRHAAEALADVLSAEWGLSELRLENGVIDTEDALKAVLHALLISGTLPSLSLAGNKKIKAGGWRLISVFLRRARSLRYLNLSDTVWDKKGIDHLVQALNYGPPNISSTGLEEDNQREGPAHHDAEPEQESEKDPEKRGVYGSFILPAPLLKQEAEREEATAIQTLRMDGCGLRVATLEPLAAGIRASDIKNLSLRRNRIGPLGAVSLALMIRDYPENAPAALSALPNLNVSGLNTPSETPDSTQPLSRRRQASAEPSSSDTAEDASLPAIPLVVSSSNGGITTRTVPDGYRPPDPSNHFATIGGVTQEAEMPNGNSAGETGNSAAGNGGPSVALQRSVRALDGVDRIGRLLTLDLKSNEIKNGVGYIAQVLKRNRTLKVLNLSDNKIEPAGLAALAEALKYNSSLETLDMSSNPCSGPNLEGIAALRTTFTVNASLKRLFLSDTSLTTEGAIALAEFLPETKTLLHLDLTSNPLIDVAGIMAISVGLKSTNLIRCLDLSVPPNNEDMSELSQSILQSCIRNTELAASSSSTSTARIKVKSSKAGTEAIWAPIKKSALVRSVKEADEARAAQEREASAKSPEGQAREYVYTLRPERVLIVSEETVRDLGKWYEAGRLAGSSKYKRDRESLPNGTGQIWEPGQLPKEEFGHLIERAKALRERIVDQIQETVDPAILKRLLSLNDLLSGLIEQSKGFHPPPRLLLPSQIVPTAYNTYHPSLPRTGSSIISPAKNRQYMNTSTPSPPTVTTRHIQARRHMRVSSVEISSPNFSIGDSDGDSDAEELDVGNFSSSRSETARSPATSGLGMGMISPSKIRTHDRPLIGILTEEFGDDARSFDKGLDNGEHSEQNHKYNNERDPIGLTSPVEKASRAWVEEEGEIFRKGTKLGVADEEEIEEKGDVSGEILRQEILDTPVARSPTRRLIPLEEGDAEPIGEEQP